MQAGRGKQGAAHKPDGGRDRNDDPQRKDGEGEDRGDDTVGRRMKDVREELEGAACKAGKRGGRGVETNRKKEESKTSAREKVSKVREPRGTARCRKDGSGAAQPAD